MEEYIDAFGVDPRDPAFQEQEAKALAAWKEQLASQQPEEEDVERVMRLRREQDDKLALLRQRRAAQRRQGR